MRQALEEARGPIQHQLQLKLCGAQEAEEEQEADEPEPGERPGASPPYQPTHEHNDP